MNLFRKAEVNHIASVILAVIAIVGLVFLVVKLTMLFVDSDMRNAKNFINGLNAKIENLGDGESNTFALRGVEGWYLVAWNREVITDRKPQKCFDKNCLCICQKPDKDTCQENGYCRGVDRSLFVNSSGFINLSEQIFKSRLKEGNGVFYASCLYFGNKLNEINITKNPNEINISLSYGDFTFDEYTNKMIPLIEICDGYKPAFLLN